jgi:putative restriction endonuclease
VVKERIVADLGAIDSRARGWSCSRDVITLTQAIDALYRLNVGVVGTGSERHERPHKPVLLLAVLDAIAAGVATPERIPWNDWIRRRFAQYFEIVQAVDDKCTPENPFHYLRSDGFWLATKLTPTGEQPMEAPPSFADSDALRVNARFVPEWLPLVAGPTSRAALREAILVRYFPAFIPQLSQLAEITAVDQVLPRETGARSAAFRRQILEIYDYQCCACGLRIWIPDRQLTFVDAAHVIPFSECRNDHPTNGIALCKNHHWAMDQGLIAPAPEGVWRISREVDPRRSKGEEELSHLDQQRLLMPSEPAYAPDIRGLTWRFSRLRLV